jgi:hypothetical protein
MKLETNEGIGLLSPALSSRGGEGVTTRRSVFNPWPWAIIATFVLFITGTVGLVVMACSQHEDLVSENYYDKEIRFQDQLDSLKRAQDLGGSASVIYEASGRRIRISLPQDQASQALTGRIELYRPSAATQDRVIPLKPDATGIQTLDAAGLSRGLWKVRVFWKCQQQEYSMDQVVKI